MLNRSAILAMSTSVLKALPGKLDIKRHSPSILYIRPHYMYEYYYMYAYNTFVFHIISFVPHIVTRERGGSVVECLTRDRRAAGSSLTGVTALCP